MIFFFLSHPLVRFVKIRWNKKISCSSQNENGNKLHLRDDNNTNETVFGRVLSWNGLSNLNSVVICFEKRFILQSRSAACITNIPRKNYDKRHWVHILCVSVLRFRNQMGIKMEWFKEISNWTERILMIVPRKKLTFDE